MVNGHKKLPLKWLVHWPMDQCLSVRFAKEKIFCWLTDTLLHQLVDVTLNYFHLANSCIELPLSVQLEKYTFFNHTDDIFWPILETFVLY